MTQFVHCDSGNRSRRRERGFTVAELLAAVAIIGILATLVIPFVVTASRALTTNRGAREIQAALLQARALAITSRQNICFQPVTGGFQFLQGTCAGTAWTGPNVNTSGIFKPADNVTTSGGAAVFTPFGNASTTTTITVSVPGGTATTVTVQASGRVTIP